MESWVGLGRNEGCTNIRISAKPGIKLGTLWLEGRDLTNCANHARPKIIQDGVENIVFTTKIWTTKGNRWVLQESQRSNTGIPIHTEDNYIAVVLTSIVNDNTTSDLARVGSVSSATSTIDILCCTLKCKIIYQNTSTRQHEGNSKQFNKQMGKVENNTILDHELKNSNKLMTLMHL